MKKLVFMLGAVAVAACTQAASVNWTCTNVKDGNGNAIEGIAYFINAATLSQDAFRALDGADAFTTALSGMYSYTPATAGKYTVAMADAVPNATLGLSDNSDYSVYLAIFDTAMITDSSKYYLTEVKDLATLSGTDSAGLKWGSQSTASQASGAWSDVKATTPDPDPEPPIDSPEPTSGLLMLIGAAGLALRRKRA